jgi:hypothetical protein
VKKVEKKNLFGRIDLAQLAPAASCRAVKLASARIGEAEHLDCFGLFGR